MAYRQYTQCYDYTPGDTPFKESDILGIVAADGLAPGAIAGLLAGLAAGGPVGLFIGSYVAVVNSLNKVAQEWRFHRLICVSGDKCAVGTIKSPIRRGDLGQFDNDQFFDLALMPYRPENWFDYITDKPAQFQSGLPGVVGLPDRHLPTPADKAKSNAAETALGAHPGNDPYTDGFQGTELLYPRADLEANLGYLYDDTGQDDDEGNPETPHSWLHCEAEGDFWVKIEEWAPVLGALGAATTVGAVAAGAAGAAEGCAIGGIFGPIGCAIGAVIGAIVGAAAAGAAGGAVGYGILQGLDNADPGNVEDANVGDAKLGPISTGDRVVVYGTHVYDGFHQGWHEFHPLKAICKIESFAGSDRTALDPEAAYVQWDPLGWDHGPENQGMTPQQVEAGLVPAGPGTDQTFRQRAEGLRRRWCAQLAEVFDAATQARQGDADQRWAVHPAVDGCRPKERPGVNLK